jgi:type II secretory ATPase GspE/PulE/Tfp pilus assembly ATPase PilB-like protein
MGMDPFNFSDALLGILAQRLARTLCKKCKEKYHPDREEFDGLVRLYGGDFDALGFEYNDDFFLYRAKGCQECSNTGYRGRIALFELLQGTDDMKLFIQNRAKIDELRKQATKFDGMTTLMQDGIRKVCLGITDLKQVRRVCIK